MSFISYTNAGMYLNRQLQQVIPTLFTKRYPQLWAQDGTIIPRANTLEPGTKEIIEESILEAGEAVITTAESEDIPLVDASIYETSFRVFSNISGFKYGVMELETARKAGRPISDVRLNVMNRAMLERTNKLLIYGDARLGATGLLNSTAVPLVNSSYDADNPATTFDQHKDFIVDNLTKVTEDSNLTEGITTILVPYKLRNIWAKTRVGTDSSMTVLNYIFDNFGVAAGGTLQRIVAVNEVQSRFLEQFNVMPAGTNRDRIVFLPGTSDAMEYFYSRRQYLMPQLRNLSYYVYGYESVSEVIIHYPNSLLYVDIPKVTA